MHTALDWFEIPARDLARARAFYERLLGITLQTEAMGGLQMAMFSNASGSFGCLQVGEGTPEPSAAGTLVYLNAGPSLDAVLARVEACGGRITTPKVELPGDMGVYAHITDTEGNRIGLHAAA